MDYKKYGREFKCDAVKLYKKSEKSLHILAKDLRARLLMEGQENFRSRKRPSA